MIGRLFFCIISLSAIFLSVACSGGQGSHGSVLPQSSQQDVARSAQAVNSPSWLPPPGTPIDAEEMRSMLLAHPDMTAEITKHPITSKYINAEGFKWSCVPGEPGIIKFPNGQVIADPKVDGVCSKVTPFPSISAQVQPEATSTPTPLSPPCPHPLTWNGNIPPSCTTSGAFRRVYSGSGYHQGYATVQLAINPTPMPTQSPKSQYKDTGFNYIEGWPGVGTSDSETGLQYNSASKNYSFYIATPAGTYYEHSYAFHPGDPVQIILDEVIGVKGTSCVTNCVQGGVFDMNPMCTPAAGFICGQGLLFSLSNWSPNCCIFARMTTIAQQTNNYSFNDGSNFGLFPWSSSNLCTIDPKTLNQTCSGWSGGTQSWPNDTTRVIVNYQNISTETDRIYLHP